MVDLIIIILVVVLLLFALRGSIRHFKGDGGCCKGGSTLLDEVERKPKFLDGPAIGNKTLRIGGMHCEHCVANVTNALNEVEGVVADVDLKTNTAKVSYDREIDEFDLKDAVKKAGYEVLSIS